MLAATQEQADHAKSLIRITYEVDPSDTSFDEAKAHPRVPDSILGQPATLTIGDAEAALAAAPYRVDLDYSTQRCNHNAIEPHAVTVAWEGERLVIHDTTQAVAHAAWTMAQVFGIEEDQVHVTSPYVGGGFGGKTFWQHHVLAAAAAKLTGRPGAARAVARGRLPHRRRPREHRAARRDRRSGRWRFRCDRPHRRLGDVPSRRSARAVHARDQVAVRGRQLQAGDRGGGHGHARQHLHARARRGGRHLRARMRGGRAGRAAAHGSDRAAHPQRTRQGPDRRHALLVAPFGGGIARRGRAVRLEQTACAARHPARGRVADRHGRRVGHLPLPAHARWCGADHDHPQRPCRDLDRRARDGHGHRHRADAGRRRTARLGDGSGELRLRRLDAAGRRPRRRVAADRLDRRLGGGGAAQAVRRAAEARRQRLAARGPEGRRGRRDRRVAWASSTTRHATKATPRSSPARSATR